MENQIQQDISQAQPLSQAPGPNFIPISTPPANNGSNWSKNLLIIILGLIIVLGSVFIGIQIGKNQSSNQQSTVAQPTIAPSQTDQITVMGVIRTSGLSAEEKQRLDLSNISYQLTDFNKNDEQDLYGYYLISNDQAIETFLGKCVLITGTEPIEWKNKNKGDSYLRTAFVPDKIELVDNSKCNPYLATDSENIEGTEKLTLRGIVNDNNRPSPDINYDYQVKLSTPLLDEDNPSGSPQKISLVNAIPDTNNV